MRSEFPVGVASFIGREDERAKLAELVTESRVVTLTGSGGCGKTRLAVEVVGDMVPHFADGIHWVDLQRVRDPAMVAPAVGAAVDVTQGHEKTLVGTLVDQLDAQHLLIVLDNCEHLVDACAELVAELSSACPQLHILATSRVPLVVAGEATFEVTGLPVPDPDASSASMVAAVDAARLFEVRARQVSTDFRIGDDNASAVAEICRRLDGIPLAVELAAARVRVLTPRQIAAGLSDRFALLTGGVRGAPARQRTLEASVEWSYDLLGDQQRLALARLSVFAGSFELDAAEAVVGGEGVDDDAVLDLVARLVERSLVKVIQRQGRARYRLLETIRAYAWKKLLELDDPDRVRDCHLAFYSGLAGRAHTALTGGQPGPWVARLGDDLDDLRAAMDWAVQSGRPVAVLDIAVPTRRFWYERGRYWELERWLLAAVDSPAATDTDRARGLVTASMVTMGRGHFSRAYGFADPAVSVARTVDADETLALGLVFRAHTGLWSGLGTRAAIAADAEEAAALVERLENDSPARAIVLTLAGHTVCYGRSLGEGVELLEQAAAISEDAGRNFHLPTVHGHLAAWILFCGELGRARQHAQEGIAWSRRIDRPGWEAAALSALAVVEVFAGDIDASTKHLAYADTLVKARNLTPTVFGIMLTGRAALVAYGSGKTDEASRAAEEYRRAAHERGFRWGEAWGAWLQGLVALEEQLPIEARENFERGRQLSVETWYPFPLGRSLLGLAGLAKEDGAIEEAWGLAHEGLEVLDVYGDRIGTAEALETIADVALAFGEPERSLRLLAASEHFLTKSGIQRFSLQADRFDHARDEAEAALAPTEAKSCWEAGSALSLADAVSYARRGRGERQRPQIGWFSLTPAERDVVRLVADGHSNAEIGERLFISVNTVKKHLSHVYAKVDVDGRAGLAAEAVRRDL